MKKLIHSILAALAFVGATQTPANAAQVQYFYHWRDDSYGVGGTGGWTSPNKVQFMLSVFWDAIDNIGRNVTVESYYTQNVPGGTNVVLANYTLTNVTSASISLGPMTTANASYAIVRLKINGGAYYTIFSDATH